MLEEDAKVSHRRPQHSHDRLAGVFGTGHFGGRQLAVQMSLGRRMSRAELAPLFGLGSAHGAADGQYLSQREFPGFHDNIIQHR
jgi:hypothetical protein